MDREDEQDVNPFSGRRAKLEAIAMDLKAETAFEKLARNKFENKFFKEKAKGVRALFFDVVDKQLAELPPRKLLSPGSISFSSDVFVGFEKEGSLPVKYEVREFIAVSMGGAEVLVFDQERGELVKRLSIGGVHKIRFSPLALPSGDLPAEVLTFGDSICRWVTKDWEQSHNDFYDTYTPRWFASRKELSDNSVPILTKLTRFNSTSAAALSHCGKYAALSDQSAARIALLQMDHCRVINEFGLDWNSEESNLNPASHYYHLEFSHDALYLAAANELGFVHIYDVKTGELVSELDVQLPHPEKVLGLKDVVNVIEFSPKEYNRIFSNSHLQEVFDETKKFLASEEFELTTRNGIDFLVSWR